MTRIIVFIFFVSFFSCNRSSTNFIVVSTESNERIVSIKDAIILLEETTANKIEELKEHGLLFNFDSNESLISVSINNANYKLGSGIKIGSNKKEVLEKLGKPIRNNIALNKGKREIGSIDAFFYKNGLFIFDNDGKVKSITLGDIKGKLI